MNVAARTTVRSIIGDVSQMSGVAPAQIIGPCRFPEYVRARDVVCYIAHRAGMSYPQIGLVLKRHHTTVMEAVRRECARRGEARA